MSISNKTKKLLAQARELPQQESAWECVVRKAPSWVEQKGKPPYRPTMIVVVDRATNFVRATEMPKKSPPRFEDVLQIILKAVINPMAEQFDTAPAGATLAGRPTQLLVKDPDLAQQLQSSLAELNISTVVAESLPAADDVYESLKAFMNPGQQVPPLTRTEGLSQAMALEFFTAADLFYRARPWEHLFNVDIIEVGFGSGAPQYVCVMGNGGQEFGLSFYSSIEDVSEVLSGVHPRRMRKGLKAFSATFDEASAAALDDLDFMEEHDIQVADEFAYPVGFGITFPKTVHPLTLAQVQTAAAAMRMLPQFVVAHMMAADDEPQSARAAFNLPPEYDGQTLELAYPVPELQSFIERAEEEAAEDDLGLIFDEDDDDWDEDDVDDLEDFDEDDEETAMDAVLQEMAAIADQTEPGAGKLMMAINSVEPPVKFSISTQMLGQIKPKIAGIKAGVPYDFFQALYAGMEGGIMIALVPPKAKSPLICSLTQLDVEPDHPLTDAIKRYQEQRRQQLNK